MLTPAVSLAHDVVIASGSSPDRAILFLHGILGSRQNLRTIARRFVEARPSWAAVLVDLRRHGDSLDTTGPDTLTQAARDVGELVGGLAHPAKAILGHSFGGKVALAWLQTDPSGLEHVFVIDSNPGPRLDAGGSENTVRVIEMLDAIGTRAFASRDDFVQEVVSRGQPRAIAQWLAQSLRRGEDGAMRFGPPMSSIHALLDDYLATDLWPVVAHPPGDAHVHLVVADRSSVLDAADRERARALEGERLSVDVLPTDHWVHAEDPDGLLRVMLASVPA